MLVSHSYTFPVSEIRKQFPALRRIYNGKLAVYLDGPGGSQVVDTSIQAISNYMSSGSANLHGQFPTSRETEELIREAKEAIADMFGAKSKEVAFGANATSLEFSISRALGRNWRKGDEIVLCESDHRANVDPWLAIAKEKGMIVNWLKVNKDTLTLDFTTLGSIITDKTRLIAIGLASNAVGTINEVQIVSSRARAVNAIVVVDAVHAAPHFSINRDELGADILLCSAYKFFGPHIGIAVIKENLFRSLNSYKLEPAPSYIPDKLETGTQSHEGIAGIKPAIEFIASLGTGETRREKIISGFKKIEDYENRLASKIRKRLSKLERVTLYQAPEWAGKTPTIAFTIDGMSSKEVCRIMSEEYSIFAGDGHFYATTLAEKLNVNKTEGWIRVGIAPYNSEEEVDLFINAVRTLVSQLQ
ncbi:cysteine desulfurase-like protein [Clostridium sp. CX1]|uniref:cysteine desulfurase-like protein n=1 Tax=Clostridium sp. CX1 TaxID=2978346 RepID=UPI0021C19FAD|nr:cysteine desulfurase-like protein [Clostridium sp. CX1]MCT8978119.1 cysteine desulfurase-like protein [Clostridium sp. CX1]